MELKAAISLALFALSMTGTVQAQDRVNSQENAPATRQTPAARPPLPGQARREQCWARWEEDRKALQANAVEPRRKLAAGQALDLTEQAIIYRADNQPSTFVTCG